MRPPKHNNVWDSQLLYTINNSFSVYLFLDTEPYLDKSKEFNNQGMKVNRAIKSYYEGGVWFASSKFNQKIWRWLGAYFTWFVIFQMWWIYSFVDKVSISMVVILLSLLCRHDNLILKLHQKKLLLWWRMAFYWQL